MQANITVCLALPDDDRDRWLKVWGHVTPGRPAKIYGDPYYCHPAEPAVVEIMEIQVLEEFGRKLDPPELLCAKGLTDAQTDAITWALEEAYAHDCLPWGED